MAAASSDPAAQFRSAVELLLEELLDICRNLQEVDEGEIVRLRGLTADALRRLEQHEPQIGELMAIRLEPVMDAWNSLIAYMEQREEHKEHEHVVGVNHVGQALRAEARDLRRHLRRSLPLRKLSQGPQVLHVTMRPDGLAG